MIIQLLIFISSFVKLSYYLVSTSRWLAQGRNVHLEDLQTRQQQLSAQRVPGYLDGIYLPPNLVKKRK